MIKSRSRPRTLTLVLSVAAILLVPVAAVATVVSTTDVIGDPAEPAPTADPVDQDQGIDTESGILTSIPRGTGYWYLVDPINRTPSTYWPGNTEFVRYQIQSWGYTIDLDYNVQSWSNTDA